MISQADVSICLPWCAKNAFSFLQGNQEPAATPDAMVQPFTTIPFPPPPQNGIPTEYGVPHTQDYAGQTSEHNLTLYGSTQPHGEQSTTTASTQNGSLAVSAEKHGAAEWCLWNRQLCRRWLPVAQVCSES